MKAMVLHEQGQPLVEEDLPMSECHEEELLIKINACAVCRTDLHVCDGDLKRPKLPLIPGHEIIGEVVETGKSVSGYQKGQRVGVPWLGHTCGHCDFCRHGQENLCDEAMFNGYTLDGGYAEYMTAHQHFVFPIPDNLNDVEAAPLLCAGLIGYRSFVMAGQAKRIGMYGFGAAAHIITQIACFEGCEVYAFTREGDRDSQSFAKKLGAVWAGDTNQNAPELLDAAIIFAPAGELLPIALRSIRKGGTVVCAGIHMSEIPAFPYEILWGERCIRSVANLTRMDGEEFFRLLERMPVKTEVTVFKMNQANTALDRLRAGKLQGAAVLVN